MDSACMHACMQVGTALSRSAPKERTTSLTGIKEKEDGQTDRQPSTGGVYGDGSTPGLGLPVIFFFQAEDGIRDFCLSRGLGDVYKRQNHLSSS